ncbi:DNA-binding transcriptional LysR family regulator [Amycolatopsis bartoniae]|nr:DNA-binding transcriptional LysR family regulator [Amycolatopsis bartoniae]
MPAKGVFADRREQVGDIHSGSVDVTLLRTPFDNRGLDSDRLWTDDYVALLGGGHRLAGRTVVEREELAGEVHPVWSVGPTAPVPGARWTGPDTSLLDWKPGPVVHDTGQYLSAIRLGEAIGLAPRTVVSAASPEGINVVPVVGLPPSELHVAWLATATSPDLARFVRHAGQLADH